MVQDANRTRQLRYYFFSRICRLPSSTFMVNAPFLSDFAGITNPNNLAQVIGIEPAFLTEVITAEDRSRFYKKHEIPKRKTGEIRIVWEVNSPELRETHKSFQRKFEDFVEKHAGYPTVEAHGYVKGRSTVTNAAIHAGHRFILHADIQNFFETITVDRIEGLFREFSINREISNILSRLLTVGEFLPLGLPTSPLLANLVCRGLDESLKSLANEKGAVYSRYADDLTFSSDSDLPDKIEIQSILITEGFEMSDRKFRRTVRGQSHFVTGLSVSESKPYIPRRLKQGIRQQLYYAQKFGLPAHLKKIKAKSIQSGINRIDGMISYINAVEPELAKKFRAQWKEILEKSSSEVNYLSRPERKARPVSIFIDESEIKTDDWTLLAIGCVIVEDVEMVTAKTLEVYQRILDDPYAACNKQALRKKGLHFVDLSEDGRTKYIEALHLLPFRAFVIYDFLPERAKYKEKYFELLNKLLPPRLSALDRAEVEIVIEQNSSVPFAELKKYITETYSSAESKHQKRPLLSPVVIDGEKLKNPPISVVDFVLAVFGQYARLNRPLPAATEIEPKKRTQAGGLAATRFERLREKYRLIVSRPTAEYFTQKNPFVSWKDGKPTEPKVNPKETEKSA